MDKTRSFLIKWTETYIRNKNVILKTLQEIKKGIDGFDLKVIYKDKNEFILIVPYVDKFEDIKTKLSALKKEDHATLIMFNEAGNFDVLISNWKDFIAIHHLKVLFANPFSKLDKKWIIYPQTHDKISDPESLNRGLATMFGTVEPLSKAQATNLLEKDN